MPDPRFLVEHLPPVGAHVELPAGESRHAVRVLRLEQGQAVRLADARGAEASGVILEIGPPVCCRVLTRAEPASRPGRLVVASATPKGGRVDTMVDGLTQAGVDRWVPLLSDRAVVTPRETKLDRLRRVADAACKQSGRRGRLEISSPMAPAVLLHSLGHAPARGAVLFLDPPAPSGTVAADLTGIHVPPRGPWLLMIGAEGGWSDAERAQIAAAGGRRWCLGPTVLRIETAAVAAAVIIRAAEAYAPACVPVKG